MSSAARSADGISIGESLMLKLQLKEGKFAIALDVQVDDRSAPKLRDGADIGVRPAGPPLVDLIWVSAGMQLPRFDGGEFGAREYRKYGDAFSGIIERRLV